MGDAFTPTLQFDDLLPTLPCFTPGSEEFKRRRLTYCASNPANPSAILCPRNANEVAAIVRLARERNVAFSVRTGGHDLYGRCIVDDVCCIDMRHMDSVEVATDRKTAVIGGGVRLGKLLTDLHTHSLVTPHGSVPTIGYVGWASLGGYGCSSAHFGLGVDQIVGAEVVNDRGEIVEADEEMMRGIRGAGGNFGIITSLRIKVYEVDKFLGGLLMIDISKGIAQVFRDTMLELQVLEARGVIPPEAVLQPLIINHPQAGRCLAVTYVWSSNDHEKGSKALEEIINHLPAAVTMNTVAAISPPDWVYMLDNFAPPSAWGGSQAITFGQLSSRVLDIMGQNLEDMPSDPGVCFSLHMLSRASPSVTNLALAEASCFNSEARQPHTMVEIVGTASSPDAMERCVKWSKAMREALATSGEAMKGSYVALVEPRSMGLKDIYGDKLDLLLSLKQKHDPDGLFRFAIPRMLD